jgi:hypothetical protein
VSALMLPNFRLADAIRCGPRNWAGIVAPVETIPAQKAV